jgi:hypothetical protein
MNNILRIHEADPVALPPLSPGFLACLEPERTEAFRDPTWAPVRIKPPAPSADVIAEARRLLPAYEAGSRPASPSIVLNWLRAIASAVRNPPGDDEVRARALLVAGVCDDIPASAFSPRSQRRAVERFTWWPSVADVKEFLTAEVSSELERIAAVRRFASMPDPVASGSSASAIPTPSEPVLGQAERDALAARLRGLSAELRAGAAQRGHAPAEHAPARPLSPAALAAAYREQARCSDPKVRALAEARLRSLESVKA